MEDLGSFGPSVVIAVGLDAGNVERLQEECAVRKFRLIVAQRRGDLPLSLQCDMAIVGTLLPDGDGRRLAIDLARAGTEVMLVNNAGSAPLSDAWSLGAVVGDSNDDAGAWLDQMTEAEQVETVSRAGRLLEALRLADSIEASATFSASTGVPVSFVLLRPISESRSGLDEALDRLTSVVGMTTVFYDAPTGERLALVINGDRRRLARLLDDPKMTSDARLAIVEVSPGDNLPAVIGRSHLSLRRSDENEERPKVLVALAAGQDKTAHTIRAALHRLDFSPLSWDQSFRYEDVRSNPPVVGIVDVAAVTNGARELVDRALAHDPPIPIVAIAEEEHFGALSGLIEAGISDFLITPLDSGELQAALARAVTVGADILKTESARREELRAASAIEDAADEAADEEPAESTMPDEAAPDREDVEEEEPVVAAEEPPELAPEAESSMEPEEPIEEEPESPPTPERVETVITALIGERLSAGESVALEGLGVLNIRHETSRIVHDEQGRTIVQPPRRVLSFDPIDSSQDRS